MRAGRLGRAHSRRGPSRPSHRRRRSGAGGACALRHRLRAIAGAVAIHAGAPRGRPRPRRRRSSRVGRRPGPRALSSTCSSRSASSSLSGTRRRTIASRSPSPASRRRIRRAMSARRDRVARKSSPQGAHGATHAPRALVRVQTKARAVAAQPELEQSCGQEGQPAGLAFDVVAQRVHQPLIHVEPGAGCGKLDRTAQLVTRHWAHKHVVRSQVARRAQGRLRSARRSRRAPPAAPRPGGRGRGRRRRASR